MSSDLLHNLGVDIPKDVLKANPRFENLLMALSERLGTDGESKTVAESSNNVKATLTTKKEIYFSKYIMFNEIKEILMERKLHLVQNSNESKDSLWDLFIDSNCKEMLSSFDGDMKLLGLSEDDFICNPDSKKMMESSLRMVNGKLESRLRGMFEEVARVYQLQLDENEPSPTLTPSNLHVLIERDSNHLRSLKKCLEEQKLRRKMLLDRFYDCLVKCARLLSDMLGTHRLKSIPENNKVMVEWLLSHCDALFSKMKMLELQLLNETYGAEAIKALGVVRRELIENSERTRRELKQATALLETYASLGSRFRSVVQEYAKVKEEIENRKWAISQLE